MAGLSPCVAPGIMQGRTRKQPCRVGVRANSLGRGVALKLRRKVPSLNALRFFEASARRLSLTEAAEELCVTQGAVSQRVKSLEAELGEALFHRTKNGLVLTQVGERLASGVREGLERIAAAWHGDAEPRAL